MAIQNAAKGFVPMRTPLEGQTLEFTASSIVFPGQAVILSSGKIIPYTITSGFPVLGVSMDYAAVDGKANVIVDPDMVYKILGDDPWTANDADIGLLASLVSNGGSATTKLATGVLKNSTASSTVTDHMCCIIVGKAGDIESGATDAWHLVKFHTMELSTPHTAT